MYIQNMSLYHTNLSRATMCLHNRRPFCWRSRYGDKISPDWSHRWNTLGMNVRRWRKWRQVGGLGLSQTAWTVESVWYQLLGFLDAFHCSLYTNRNMFKALLHKNIFLVICCAMMEETILSFHCKRCYMCLAMDSLQLSTV